jgi:hypothetical protein
MGRTYKNGHAHESPDQALTPLDREIALLCATTRLFRSGIARELHIHITTVQEALYKPNVRRRIAELIELRDRELIQQSVAHLLEAQENDRVREQQRIEAARARIPPRTEQHKAKLWEGRREWHIRMGHKVKDIENE